MPTTTRGIPYPGPGDAPNVPADIHDLAAWLDANLPTSGIYTPVLSVLSGLDSATAHPMAWIRVGDVVTVDGPLEIDPTTTGNVSVRIALPVASNLTGADDVSGLAVFDGTNTVGSVGTSISDDKAQLVYTAVSGSALTARVHFAYKVI
jgi:hypothetical protein